MRFPNSANRVSTGIWHSILLEVMGVEVRVWGMGGDIPEYIFGIAKFSQVGQACVCQIPIRMKEGEEDKASKDEIYMRSRNKHRWHSDWIVEENRMLR